MVSDDPVSVVTILKSLESLTGKVYLYHLTSGGGAPTNSTEKVAASPSATLRGSSPTVRLGPTMFF